MTVQAHGTRTGDTCPRCQHAIAGDAFETGRMLCPHCNGSFDLVAFTPPRHVLRLARVSDGGPESAGGCANHPGNAAVANCDRCGIVMCGLCEMQLESGRYCPPCFERVMKDDGAELARTFPDHAGRARLSARLGILLFFLGLPLSFGAISFAVKALRTRQLTGERKAGIIWSICLAVLSIAFSAFLLYSVAHRKS